MGPLEAALMGMFLGSAGADIASGRFAKGQGAHEANPIMKHELVMVGASVSVLPAIHIVWKRNKVLGVVTVAGVTAVHGWAAVHNINLGRRLRDGNEKAR